MYNPDPLAFPDGWCDRCIRGPMGNCPIFDDYVDFDHPDDVKELKVEWEMGGDRISCREFVPFYARSLGREAIGKLSVSFGWTAEQLLAGSKTVTRREWKAGHARKFAELFRRGDWCRALDGSCRRGGKQIGWLRLTRCPYLERLDNMPKEDVAAEGFPELSKEEFIARFFREESYLEVWVVRFEFKEMVEIHDRSVNCLFSILPNGQIAFA